MSDKIQFFYNPMSRARIAHWALEETGVPYEVRTLSFDKGEHKSAEYLKLNPMGKVPAIVHRGKVITEVAAILAYLGDSFPRTRLAPTTDDPDRATYLRWMFFMASNWEAAVIDKNFPRATPVRASMLGYGTYEDTMSAVEAAIRPGSFVLGDHFTMADLLIASQLSYALMFKTIDPRASFVSFVERCEARPAYKRAHDQALQIMDKMKK